MEGRVQILHRQWHAECWRRTLTWCCIKRMLKPCNTKLLYIQHHVRYKGVKRKNITTTNSITFSPEARGLTCRSNWEILRRENDPGRDWGSGAKYMAIRERRIQKKEEVKNASGERMRLISVASSQNQSACIRLLLLLQPNHPDARFLRAVLPVLCHF